ncbi:MAG TPA: 2'-5' RNA ligase family protein [Acidimicrobiales bacterium]|nr:2'-5' RNA ligase family protein [Acidimicrobiales bacterium]
MTSQSALFVPVPEAEPVVGALRQELDPSAQVGIPAHITVLYPFAGPGELAPSMLDEVEDVLAKIEPFDYALTELRWFDERVLYVAPSPGEPFHDISMALMARFPQFPPYGGAYPDVIPHLCIGEDAGARRLRRAARRTARHLPLSARATEVWLMATAEGERAWSLRRTFTLGWSPRVPRLARVSET